MGLKDGSPSQCSTLMDCLLARDNQNLAVGQADFHANLPDGQSNIFLLIVTHWTSNHLIWVTSFNLKNVNVEPCFWLGYFERASAI
jgi:hypothetical protein